jgi:acetyl-CoA carboxylase biotin carboxyl carrier protein
MKQQDIDDLRKLIDFLKAHQVAEFDLDRGDIKIRLKFQQLQAPVAYVPAAAPVAAAPVAAVHAPASAPAPAPANPDDGLHIVKSPIVGTFYGSPSPGAASFVAAGDHVEKGQVICIVEAMKLMNEIETDAAGEIVRCLVSNGQAIEFGQPLFAIRPA